MKIHSFSEMSLEELTKRQKLLKGVVIGFGIVWLLMIGFGVFIYVTKSAGKALLPMTILPITMLPSFIQLKSITNEIKSRQFK